LRLVEQARPITQAPHPTSPRQEWGEGKTAPIFTDARRWVPERREPYRVASLVLLVGDLLAARHFGQGLVNIRLAHVVVAFVKRPLGHVFVNELTGRLFDRRKNAARYARFFGF